MFIRTVTNQLLWLPPRRRRLLLIAAGALLLPLAVWLSFWLRLAHPFTSNFVEGLWLLPAAWLTGLPLYVLSAQYKGLTRYSGSRALYWLALGNGLLVLLLFACGGCCSCPCRRVVVGSCSGSCSPVSPVRCALACAMCC